MTLLKRKRLVAWMRQLGRLSGQPTSLLLLVLMPALGCAGCAFASQLRGTEGSGVGQVAVPSDELPFDLPDGYEIAAPSRALVAAPVVQVIDGDTIHVRLDGEVRSVRYVGVNCPEVEPGDRPGTPGRRATEFNRELVEDQTVYLERDVSETDSYDRLLRYVWLEDGRLVNAELVRAGMAYAKEYRPDTRHHEALMRIQDEARRNGVGIWAPERDAIYILAVSVDSNPEYVQICNGSETPQVMAGWRLRSVRGDQWYDFPDDYVLRPGTCVRVLSGPDASEYLPNRLFWTHDTVWSNSQPDPAELYDDDLYLVDRRDE